MVSATASATERVEISAAGTQRSVTSRNVSLRKSFMTFTPSR
jgi:hypothetical protein